MAAVLCACAALPARAQPVAPDEPGDGAGGQAPAEPAAPESPAALDAPAATPTEGVAALVLPVKITGKRWRGADALRLALDTELSDTAQDLGLLVDVAEGAALREREIGELDLADLARARKLLVIQPLVALGADRGEPVELRLVAARPGARNLAYRIERVAYDDAVVRAASMLRDVASEAPPRPAPRPRPGAGEPEGEPDKSPGRAVLVAHGTALGGFIGYSIQRSARSDDPRLLFPLMAVGAGVGLGSAVIIADEWDLGVGDAWYLAAGAWWPAVAGHLIYGGRFAGRSGSDASEAWSFGLVASTTGVTLAAVATLPHPMREGGAVLAHSGGALGVLSGGLVQVAVDGSVEAMPLAGMGYGAAAGWLVAATTAIHVPELPALRMLTVDLGIVLGGLAGASAASPLLFAEPSKLEVRGWVGATGAGMLAGGLLAGFLSEPDTPTEGEPTEPEAAEAARSGPADIVARWQLPEPTVLGESADGRPVPGVVLRGELW
ncbi:MAG: hypothetical protein HY908_35710 [Myxococcales bacterium]|nr:hypothetical protein [Myxococcales bacterium]